MRELSQVVEGADLPGPIYLASNFLLANGEIDCLLLMPHGIVVLDLKAYEGEVHGAEEGEWQVDGPDGTTVPLKTNLFHQLRTHRFDLAGRLLRIREAAFPQIEEKDLMKVGAWGYFKRGSTYPEGQIDLDRVKWFDFVTADTLAERLMLVDVGFTIGEREMDAIMGALHLAPSEGLVPSANGTEPAAPVPSGGAPSAPPNLEAALVDRMDSLVARMEAIPQAIAGLAQPRRGLHPAAPGAGGRRGDPGGMHGRDRPGRVRGAARRADPALRLRTLRGAGAARGEDGVRAHLGPGPSRDGPAKPDALCLRRAPGPTARGEVRDRARGGGPFGPRPREQRDQPVRLPCKRGSDGRS